MNTIKTLTISLLLASWLSAADSRDLEMDSGGSAAGGRSYISHAEKAFSGTEEKQVEQTAHLQDATDAAPMSGTSASTMTLSPAAAATIGAIQVLEKGGQQIYTSSLTLPSGEIAYFACELLFSIERVACWHRYVHYTAGISGTVARILRDSIEIDGRYSIAKQTAIIQKDIPSADEQRLFGELLDRIGDKRKGFKSLSGIVPGASNSRLQPGNFVAYISKNPITDFCSLPGLPITNGLIDGGTAFMDISYEWITQIKRYTECYAHILMCVSSYSPPTIATVPPHIDRMNTYENRGIFRNPLSMIDGNYKGLAIPLHAFTGKVWLSKHPGMEYMLVKPDGMVVMRQLITAAFDDDELVKNSGTIGVKIDALNKNWMKLALFVSPLHNI